MKRPTKTKLKPKSQSKTINHYALFALAIVLAILSGLAVLYAVHVQRQDAQTARQIQAASALVVTAQRDAGARAIMSGKPIEGKRGLIVTVKVTNNTTKPQAFIPTHQTFIRDGVGHSYQLTPLDEVRQPIAGGQLRPGESRSGELSYIVDTNATRLRFYFDSRWDNIAPVVFDL